MAAFVEENFSDCWNVIALRNAQYYQTQILEQQSEFGGMRLVFEEEKLVCIYAYAKEEGLEIREPLYLEGKEDLFWRRWMVLENRKKRSWSMALKKYRIAWMVKSQ